MYINPLRKRTWAEISLDNAEYNFNLVKSHVDQGTKICCVVKADAYGHGAAELSKKYSELGADFLAVSNIEEALQLRNNGIDLPVLILGYTPAECAEILSQNDIIQCVYSYDYALLLGKEAEEKNVRIKIHIKIDSGMGRIGFRCRRDIHDEMNLAYETCMLPGLIPDGIFTHFSVADGGGSEESYTKWQFENFKYAVDYLAAKGINFNVRHCANSAAILDYTSFHLDMVRAGIILYGMKPSDTISNIPDLKPVMTFKTIVTHIKTVLPGDCIGYGKGYVAEEKMKVATISVGYADGLDRSSSGYSVLVNGKKAKIIGRICMDQTMINVDGIDCKTGDVVTIFGDDPEANADILARRNSTINYEILCKIGKRIPRAYVKDGKIISWSDGLVPDL